MPGHAVAVDAFPNDADHGPSHQDGNEEHDGEEERHPDAVGEVSFGGAGVPGDSGANPNPHEPGNRGLQVFLADESPHEDEGGHAQGGNEGRVEPPFVVDWHKHQDGKGGGHQPAESAHLFQ